MQRSWCEATTKVAAFGSVIRKKRRVIWKIYRDCPIGLGNIRKLSDDWGIDSIFRIALGGCFCPIVPDSYFLH